VKGSNSTTNSIRLTVIEEREADRILSELKKVLQAI